MRIFETDRLYFRQMVPDDIVDLKQMLQEPKVMYAYEHDFSDQDVQEWYERQRMRYEQYGFGLWAMVSKDNDEMIGQAGLTMQPYKGSEVLEIGYLLKYWYWHLGYATEAAKGCRDYAFHALGAPKVHSVIKSNNFASMRVAERVGMEKEDEFITQYYNGDMLHYLYSMNNPQKSKIH